MDTDSLIRDILALEPSLAPHEAELRALMSEFSQVKPRVLIEDSFRNSLRARILTNPPARVAPVHSTVGWWMTRLVPLGALALLLIVLVPDDILHAPETVTKTENERSENEDTSETTSPESVSMFSMEMADAPSEMGDMSRGGEMGLSDTSESVPYMKMQLPPTPELAFTVVEQTPGQSIRIEEVTVTQPSFITLSRIEPYGSEILFGISPLILPGTTVDLPIYTRMHTRVGEIYSVRLHIDTGNRVFSEQSDPVATDSFGNEQVTTVEIISGY